MQSRVFWNEPDENFGDVIKSLSISQAIDYQKAHAMRMKPGLTYNSDEEALEEFLLIHWAWIGEIISEESRVQ